MRGQVGAGVGNALLRLNLRVAPSDCWSEVISTGTGGAVRFAALPLTSRVTLCERMLANWPRPCGVVRILMSRGIAWRDRNPGARKAASARSLTKENNEFVQRPPRRSHQIARRLHCDADDDSIPR